jgi:hypothetical protein
MANKTVGVGYFGGNPKTRMSNVLAGDARTGGRAKFNQTSAMYSNSPYANLPAPISTYTTPKEKRVKDQSRVGVSAETVQRATVPGGRGIMGLDGVRLKPTANAPKATVSGGTPTPANAAPKRTVGGAIRTFVNEKLTPTRKTGPQMGLNRVTGNTTGFTSGTKTGKTITKSGVATKTPMSASRRAEQNAFNKGGVAGPSRGGGGGSFRSSGGGGRGMTGGGGMGASGRGTGGKR